MPDGPITLGPFRSWVDAIILRSIRVKNATATKKEIARVKRLIISTAFMYW